MIWAAHDLGDICEVQRGTTITQTQARSGNVPVVAGGITPTYYHDTPNRAASIITVSASGANAGFVNFWNCPIFASDCSTIASQRSDVDIRFVYHFLKSKQNYINTKLRSGAAQPHVYAKDIAKLQISLAPIPEQRRIAAILDQADALRAKRREALAQLDELQKSIFIEMFGDPISNPKNWECKPLKEIFNFRTGKLDSNAAVQGGTYPFFTCSREDLQIDSYAFDCEALLLAGNNANADYSVKHYKGKFNAYQRTYVITLQDEGNNYEYAAFVLENHLAELKRMSKGSSTKYLTLELLNRIQIPIPPKKQQSYFAERIQALKSIRTTYSKSQSELENLFGSLQHRAFRGEL